MKRFERRPGRGLGRGELVLLVATTAAAWFWLGRTEGGVDWLTVEAPQHAIAGELLPVRVHVAGLKEASHLCADLHWSNVHDTSNGYLASGGAKPVGKEGGSFDFEIMVRATNGLRFVQGVIYISRTADWSDHAFAAATDLIPVAGGHDGKAPALVRVPVHQLLEDGGQKIAPPTAIPRLMTGFLLLAASVAAWRTFRSSAGCRETSSRDPHWWRALAVALTLAGIWELFGLENWLGAQARALAHAEDAYYSRAVFQKGIISVTIAATFVFLGFVWRKRRPHQLSLLFFGLYLAISIVNLLSFHSLDKYAGLSWHGITLMGALKFVCAAATLKGVWQIWRNRWGSRTRAPEQL